MDEYNAAILDAGHKAVALVEQYGNDSEVIHKELCSYVDTVRQDFYDKHGSWPAKAIFHVDLKTALIGAKPEVFEDCGKQRACEIAVRIGPEDLEANLQNWEMHDCPKHLIQS